MPTRRGFLKLLGIGAGAAVVAPSVDLSTPVVEAAPDQREPFSRNEFTFYADAPASCPPQFIAPGAFCVPVSGYYELGALYCTARPVMDSLPEYRLRR